MTKRNYAMWVGIRGNGKDFLWRKGVNKTKKQRSATVCGKRKDTSAWEEKEFKQGRCEADNLSERINSYVIGVIIRKKKEWSEKKPI